MVYQRAKTTFQARVLIVDDNEVNLEVAKLLLRSLGCSADVALGGQRAVEMVQQSVYDLIFMDIAMPDKDGFQTTMDIRNIETKSGYSAKIVAVSAHIDNGDVIKKCLENGMNDCVAKPLSQAMLENRLESWGVKKIFKTT